MRALFAMRYATALLAISTVALAIASQPSMSSEPPSNSFEQRSSDTSATALASLMLSAFATGIEQRHTVRADVGSCTAYGGLPNEDGETAGMAFISGGTFMMGSERYRQEERFTHLVRVDGFEGLPLQCRHDEPSDQLGESPAIDDAGQALLRLLRDRCGSCAASCTEGMG
jgi:formylglycine-generating enzyme required for sulfatase activity